MRSDVHGVDADCNVASQIAPEKLNLLINLMVNDTKLKVIPDGVGVTQSTAYLWRIKAYAVCGEIKKGAMLSGEVCIDVYVDSLTCLSLFSCISKF